MGNTPQQATDGRIDFPVIHYLEGSNRKAQAIEYKSDGDTFIICVSYETILAAVINGKLFRVHNPPSQTSTRHLGMFFRYVGLPEITRKQFEGLPVIAEG